jgi:hypothetical protein
MKHNCVLRTMSAASDITIIWLLVIILFPNESVANENKRLEKEAEMLRNYKIEAPTGIAIDSARNQIIFSDIGRYGYKMYSVEQGDKNPNTLGSGRAGFIFTDGLHVDEDGYHKLGDDPLLDSLEAPRGITIYEDTLYIADGQEIIALNLEDTTIVYKLQFNFPDYKPLLYDAIGDSSGNIYFSDYISSKIIRLDIATRVLSDINPLGAGLNNPSAMFFEKENNRIIYGTADNPSDSAKLMALDLANDSCYMLMQFDFRNVAGITRDRHGDYYLTQANEKENGFGESKRYGSYIYKMKGDFTEHPEIISIKNDDIFGMTKIIPDTDTLLFNEISKRTNWMFREDLSLLAAKPRLLTPTPNRDSLAYSCQFTWEIDEDSIGRISVLEVYYNDITSNKRLFHVLERCTKETFYYYYDYLEPGRKYKWFVRGLSKGSELLYTGISDTNEFQTYSTGSIPVVTLVSPLDAATDVPVKFDYKWNAFPGAESYLIETYEWSLNDEDQHYYGAYDTTKTKFPALDHSNYWWRVRVDDQNLSTGWSEWRTFKTVDRVSYLDSAKAIYPPAGNVYYGYNPEMTFRWHPVPGATSYIFSCLNCGTDFYEETVDTSMTLSLDSNGHYSWFVIAINDSSYSEFESLLDQTQNVFRTGDSTIQSPGILSAKRFHNDALRPTLYWDNTGANQYIIHVTKDYGGEFADVKLKDKVLQGGSEYWNWDDLIIEELLYTNSFKFSEDLDPNAIYRWRVMARIQEGYDDINISEMSDPMKFKLEDIEVGIDEYNEKGIIVYPNPVSQGTQLYIESKSMAINKIDIIDNLGQVVRSQNIGSGIRSQILDTADLPRGSYVLRIAAGNKLVTRKIVIL